MKTLSSGRLLNILDYALSSLHRKWAKNLTVLLAFTLVIFFFSSLQLMNRSLSELSLRIFSTAPDITLQQMSAGRQVHIHEDVKKKLGTIFGITGVRERIWGYYFDESNGANYTVIGMDDFAKESKNHHWIGLSQGRLPKPGERGKVIISEAVQKKLELGNRKFFTLFRPDLSQISFETLGIFDNSYDIITGDTILMSKDDARTLFDLPKGFTTDLLISVGNPLETYTIAEKISSRLPGVRVVTRDQILKTYKVVFSWRNGLGSICLLSGLLAFVILAWDKATGLSHEELREVGILKVLGWQSHDLILLRMSEAGIISILAFLFGYLLSWVHVVYLDGTLFRPIFLGWSILRPSFSLVPPFQLTDMLLVFSISVIPYLCATSVPAWRSAVVRADSVI